MWLAGPAFGRLRPRGPGSSSQWGSAGGYSLVVPGPGRYFFPAQVLVWLLVKVGEPGCCQEGRVMKGLIQKRIEDLALVDPLFLYSDAFPLGVLRTWRMTGDWDSGARPRAYAHTCLLLCFSALLRDRSGVDLAEASLATFLCSPAPLAWCASPSGPDLSALAWGSNPWAGHWFFSTFSKTSGFLPASEQSSQNSPLLRVTPKLAFSRGLRVLEGVPLRVTSSFCSGGSVL